MGVGYDKHVALSKVVEHALLGAPHGRGDEPSLELLLEVLPAHIIRSTKILPPDASRTFQLMRSLAGEEGNGLFGAPPPCS